MGIFPPPKSLLKPGSRLEGHRVQPSRVGAGESGTSGLPAAPQTALNREGEIGDPIIT